MSLQIIQEASGLQVIGKFTNSNYKYIGIAHHNLTSPSLPQKIKELANGTNIWNFMIAIVKNTGGDPSFLFGGQMNSVNHSGVGDGILVIYDYANDNVVDSQPTNGDVKLGAGDN